MNINVTVSDLDLSHIMSLGGEDETPYTLGDAVAEAAVRKLADDGIWDSIRERVRTIRDEEIRAQVVPLVTTAIEAGIQQTNSFGEPVGVPKTLRDMILERVTQQLQAVADPHSYGTRRELWVDKLVREQVEQVLKAELSEAIKAEKDRITAAVRARAADIMARALTEGVCRS